MFIIIRIILIIIMLLLFLSLLKISKFRTNKFLIGMFAFLILLSVARIWNYPFEKKYENKSFLSAEEAFYYEYKDSGYYILNTYSDDNYAYIIAYSNRGGYKIIYYQKEDGKWYWKDAKLNSTKIFGDLVVMWNQSKDFNNCVIAIFQFDTVGNEFNISDSLNSPFDLITMKDETTSSGYSYGKSILLNGKLNNDYTIYYNNKEYKPFN